MSDFTNLTDAADEDAYLKQSVEILPEAIREEFVRIPADLAYWGGRYADAIKDFLVAEQQRKTAYAHARLNHRAAAAAGGKKLTEADVDALVETDHACGQAKLLEIEMEAAKVSAKIKLDAVSAKKDMVMSLGAYIRAEMAPSHLNR